MNMLFDAVRDGDVEAARSLLDAKAEVNVKNEWSETPLIKSAMFENPDVVKLLLNAGADVEARDEEGQTALISASTSVRADNLRLLLDAGANVNATDNMGRTPLMAALNSGTGCMWSSPTHDGSYWVKISEDDKQYIDSKTAVVRLLLNSGANVNRKDSDGFTALMFAKEVKLMRLLLCAGANVHAKDGAGRSALTVAADSLRADAVRLLLDSGADVNAIDNDGRTALMATAAPCGQTYLDRRQILKEMGKELTARKVDDLELVTILQEEVARLLLGAGADVNARHRSGFTALILAAGTGRPQLSRLLLEAGADMNASHNYGFSALMAAEQLGRASVAELLRNAGAIDGLGRNVSWLPLFKVAWPRISRLWQEKTEEI